MIRDYCQMLADEGRPEATGKMNQLAGYSTHGIRNGAQSRRAVHDSHRTAEIIAPVDKFFAAAALQSV